MLKCSKQDKALSKCMPLMTEQVEEKVWFCISRKTGIIVDMNLRPVPIKGEKKTPGDNHNIYFN